MNDRYKKKIFLSISVESSDKADIKTKIVIVFSPVYNKN